MVRPESLPIDPDMVGMMVILLGGAILAGFAGSLLGLGGGILLIPIFTLALG